MKNTGMIRNIDTLGRITLPKEIRRSMDLQIGEQCEIWIEGTNIILRPIKSSCCFCGSNEELMMFQEKIICQRCILEMESRAVPLSDNQ